MKKFSLLMVFGVILASAQLFISDSYAYIDPGTGSLVIQMIIGGLVGVGITCKIYWYKIKEGITTIIRK